MPKGTLRVLQINFPQICFQVLINTLNYVQELIFLNIYPPLSLLILSTQGRGGGLEQGEHVNSTQKGPDLWIKSRTFLLWGKQYCGSCETGGDMLLTAGPCLQLVGIAVGGNLILVLLSHHYCTSSKWCHLIKMAELVFEVRYNKSIF